MNRAQADAAEQTFERVVAATTGTDTHEKTMFGCRTLLVGTQMVICLYHGDLAVRLGRTDPAYGTALALQGSKLWDPTRREHPFRDWAIVSSQESELWVGLRASPCCVHEERAGNPETFTSLKHRPSLTRGRNGVSA
jgi:hypothetical protein